MDNAPGPDKVKAIVSEGHFLGIHLKHEPGKSKTFQPLGRRLDRIIG